MSEQLENAKRLVIKIGSALLVDEANGLRRDWLQALVEDIVRLRQRGQEVVIVSSGAVALGAERLDMGSARQRLRDSQAAAAVGQIRLAHAWEDQFAVHNMTVAQILLTLDDTETRRRYLNARETVETLLGLGAIPVINENDTVATHEIRYGDNDRLAARVAQMISADCLVILSDVDGLYTANPDDNDNAEFIAMVPDITAEIEDMAGEPKAMGVGRGGMITKVAAAKIAVASGCHVLLTNGVPYHPLRKFENTGRGTWFNAPDLPTNLRKQWIAGSLQAAGTIVVDEGAVNALLDGNSLLPAGVSAVDGQFDRGDTIIVVNNDGDELARGLAAYSSDDAARIKGHNSRDIEEILGYRGRKELIHRDNLVLHLRHQDTEGTEETE